MNAQSQYNNTHSTHNTRSTTSTVSVNVSATINYLSNTLCDLTVIITHITCTITVTPVVYVLNHTQSAQLYKHYTVLARRPYVSAHSTCLCLVSFVTHLVCPKSLTDQKIHRRGLWLGTWFKETRMYFFFMD